MPHHRSAWKRVKTNTKATERNTHYKSLMKTAIKKVLNANDKGTAQQELVKVVSLLDKMAVKGIIHKNKAANQKSRLTRFVNAM